MNSEYNMDLDFGYDMYDNSLLFNLANENVKQEAPMETWNESEDLLQFLGTDVGTEDFPAGVEVKRNDLPLEKCRVDDVFNNFTFDSILGDGLKNRFDSPASDSGFSSDNNDFQVSGNCERNGDCPSPDTMDTVSDVSSTSDLGSVGSPASAVHELDSSMLYEYPSPPPEESSEKLYFIPASNEDIISDEQQLSPTKIKVDLPTNKANIKSISLKSFKQHKSTTSDRILLPGQTGGSGLLQNVQTIVLNQSSNAAQVLRKGTTYLKTISNGKSILVPVSVKEGSNQVRTIKVINNVGNNINNKKNLRTLTVRQMPNVSVHQNRAVLSPKPINGRPVLKVSPTTLVTDTAHRFVAPSITIKEEPYDEESPQNGQQLILTEEEKKLLKKEQISLPTQYPLSKQQERDLKRIRRKIRNKISAQDSRKRKKEYVDGLEDRMKRCSDDNQKLNKRIRQLESQNESLSCQLKRLQQFVGGRNHPHASTAVMMLALSFALIVIPTLRPQDAREQDLVASAHLPSPGQTRNLLEAGISAVNGNLDGANQEDVNVSEKPEFHPLTDHDYAPLSKRPRLDQFSPMGNKFSLPGKGLQTEGEPPDFGLATFFGSLLNSFGKNWTDNSRDQLNPWNVKDRTRSLVVNLNSKGKFMDDIELE